jgi:hypothetical protein
MTSENDQDLIVLRNEIESASGIDPVEPISSLKPNSSHFQDRVQVKANDIFHSVLSPYASCDDTHPDNEVVFGEPL